MLPQPLVPPPTVVAKVVGYTASMLDAVRPVQPLTPAEGAGRTVNAWLEVGQYPLKLRELHHIWVNIGRSRDDPGGHAFSEPQWGTRSKLDLLFTLAGRAAAIDPTCRYATLSKHGDMTPIYFRVTPHETGVLRLRLSIYLKRELMLLEELGMNLSVVRGIPKAYSLWTRSN
jgi:hypothetical protein